MFGYKWAFKNIPKSLVVSVLWVTKKLLCSTILQWFFKCFDCDPPIIYIHNFTPHKNKEYSLLDLTIILWTKTVIHSQVPLLILCFDLYFFQNIESHTLCFGFKTSCALISNFVRSIDGRYVLQRVMHSSQNCTLRLLGISSLNS